MPNTLHSARHKVIAAAIKEARLAKPMTQAQLAKELGRHQPFVVSIERNQRRVDLVELMQISTILDLDLKALLKRIAETPAD